MICDLGCGAAGRIIKIAEDILGIKGRGLEVNVRAVDLARKAVADHGLSDRIEIVQADVKNIAPGGRIGAGVDLLMMCFMGHDLWPEPDARRVFRGMRDHFPDCERFVMADTVRGDDTTWEGIPVFQLGFESVHAIMRQYIPTFEEWELLFKATGWRLNQLTRLDVPNSFVFDLSPV
jgi:hypothetical protein